MRGFLQVVGCSFFLQLLLHGWYIRATQRVLHGCSVAAPFLCWGSSRTVLWHFNHKITWNWPTDHHTELCLHLTYEIACAKKGSLQNGSAGLIRYLFKLGLPPPSPWSSELPNLVLWNFPFISSPPPLNFSPSKTLELFFTSRNYGSEVNQTPPIPPPHFGKYQIKPDDPFRRGSLLIWQDFKIAVDIINKRPAAAWPSIAAPGVSLCGKARSRRKMKEERRKRRNLFLSHFLLDDVVRSCSLLTIAQSEMI